MKQDEKTLIANGQQDCPRQPDGVPSRANGTPRFTQEQRRLVELISSHFCGNIQQMLSRYRQTAVVARLVAAEAIRFWEILNCLPCESSTALVRCQPGGEFCLIEVDQGLLKWLYGEGVGTHELGNASMIDETHPEG